MPGSVLIPSGRDQDVATPLAMRRTAPTPESSPAPDGSSAEAGSRDRGPRKPLKDLKHRRDVI